MDKSKVFKQHEIPLSNTALNKLIKKWEDGKGTPDDYVYIGANELEGRKNDVFVKKKNWDGDTEAIKNE